jgi:O-antigen ligase
MLILLSGHVVAAIIAALTHADQFRSGTVFRVSGFYGSPSPVYLILSMASLLFAVLAQKCKRPFIARVCLVAMLISLGVTACTFSRSASIVLFTGVIALLWQRWHVRFSKLIFLSFSAAAFLPFLARMSTEADTKLASASLFSRGKLWQMGVQVWEHNPFFGGGLQAFPRSAEWESWSQVKMLIPLEPKNVYLNFLCDHGIVGLCVATMFFISLWRFPISTDSEENSLMDSFAALRRPVLAALLACGIGDTPIFGDFHQIPSTVICLCLLAISISGYDSVSRETMKGEAATT